MPAPYKTPGVYIEEIPKFPPSVAQVETAIPAFIGYTEMAKWKEPDDLRNVPWRITSLLEYETYFGTTVPETGLVVLIEETQDSNGNVTGRKASGRNTAPLAKNMYYALQAYFANGGGPCYITSVGPLTGPVVLSELQAGLTEVEKEDEVTLLVFPEAQALIGDLSDAATYADYAALMSDALNQCGELQDRFTVMDLPPIATGENIRMASDKFRDLSMPLDNLKYGAVYAPHVETVFNYLYDEATVAIERSVNGAAAVAEDPLATLNASDGIQGAMVKIAIDAIPMVLPSSSLVVGQYAKVDSTRGVWKAPANVALSSVVGAVVKINHKEQEDLNVHTSGKSINAIRAFTGKGLLIWGSRTLAGNDNEWRYVPVRRFFNMAEESIKKATEQFVFEPNDANTWTKVRAMIENFLILQWRAGALAGPTPESAFFVKVGLGETMTPLDILEGRMNVEIGMAVVRPAEFIILKFSHKMQEA